MTATRASLGGNEAAIPLGRLGSGLALIYHDVVSAPLPPDLMRLAEQLESRAPGSEIDAPQVPAE